jgi:hypothetical protein
MQLCRIEGWQYVGESGPWVRLVRGATDTLLRVDDGRDNPPVQPRKQIRVSGRPGLGH